MCILDFCIIVKEQTQADTHKTGWILQHKIEYLHIESYIQPISIWIN